MGEWDDVREALAAEGVDPTDFGRFVNRVVPGVIEPSTFEAERATPVLLAWLPRVRSPRLKETIAAHLKTRAARGIAAPTLIEEFRGAGDDHVRWQIADTLQTVMKPEHHEAVLALAEDRRYGMGRQMLVLNLWRVKTRRVEEVLVDALRDPDVALHAGSALRRLVGNERAVELLASAAEQDDERAAQAARRNLSLARKALAKRGDRR